MYKFTQKFRGELRLQILLAEGGGRKY